MSAVMELIEQPESKEKAFCVPKSHRFTVQAYDLMVERGILTENDNVELLNGKIIDKMPKGTKHTSVTRFITKYFYRTIGNEAVIQVQDPIQLNEFSEPEPDIVLARIIEGDYTENHPKPEDILLIVEVSDSTIQFDRNDKCLAYSQAGIQHYLIVNVENNTIEDYRNPAKDGYGTKQTYKTGDKFSLLAFPKIEIAVEDFLQN